MFGRRYQLGQRLGRRLLAFAVIVAVCASFFPLPFAAAPSKDKDRSEPFPCMDRSCGCASAEQCWKQCCCFSNAEKVVWAQRNGVTPPEYVAVAARAESKAALVRVESVPKKPCSHCERSNPSNCSGTACETHTHSACCSNSGCDDEHRSAAAESRVDSTGYVIGVEMMKCRGQGPYANSLPWAVVPVVPVIEVQADPGTWDRPLSVVACSIALEPPEPPPRLA